MWESTLKMIAEAAYFGALADGASQEEAEYWANEAVAAYQEANDFRSPACATIRGYAGKNQ